MKELSVISKSKSLMKEVYNIARSLPNFETYGVKQQIIRSALSIGSNLAEGQQRTDKDFIRFIRMARGSIFELKFQLEVIQEEYNIWNIENTLEQLEEISKMTYSLMLKLTADSSKK